MSGTTNCPEDLMLEDARRHLQALMDSSTVGGSGLYLQQVAQTGLLVLDTLTSGPEAQQLAEIIVQQLDDIYDPLQNVASVNESLENDLLEFLGAIAQIQEEVPHFSGSTFAEKVAAFEENLQEISARIAWRIVANDDSELAIALEEEAGSPSLPSKLPFQTTDDDNSSMSNLLHLANPPLDITIPDGNDGGPSSQSITTDERMAFRLQIEEFSRINVTTTSRTQRLPGSSAMLAGSDPSTHRRGQALRAARTLLQGIDLAKRFQHGGGLQNLTDSITLFRESLLLCPSEPQLRFMATGCLATALLDQYRQMGDYSSLADAITKFREVLDLSPSGHPARAPNLNGLSNALIARYEREGSQRDLSEATEFYREALRLCPPGHPHRAVSLSSLSGALMAWYEREGNLRDLSEAIEYQREGLQLCPPGHPIRAASLSNLSSTLSVRYRGGGSLQDLLEATEYQREALQLRPPGHPDRVSSLHNLSNTLAARYECEGTLHDLSEATEYQREALQLCPPGHPLRAASLTNLSTTVFTRYEREGSVQDLSEVTEHRQEALELRPPGHPERATSLNNLSSVLLARYEREGSLHDLSEAIEFYREALQLSPPGHPHRAGSLSNLSTSLLARFKREGGLHDLSEATECYRETLQLCPPGHPHRASALNNLSNSLMYRYGQEGSLSDLSEATGLRRGALELRPPGHPDRTKSLSALSRALGLHVIGNIKEATDAQSDLPLVQEIFEVLREAVDLPNCPPLNRLEAALQWIESARGLASKSMLNAYIAALDQLDIVLATRDTLENKHTQLISSGELSRCRRLGVEAASYAVRQGRMDLAVELLERGRNLLFAQVGRYRADLQELRRIDPDLADRFASLSNRLDASVLSDQSALQAETAFEDPIERYRRVSSAWNQVVDNIRAVEGFQHFLKYPPYVELRSAAAEGPIIIIIPGDDQSDALVVTKERDTPHRISLPDAGMKEVVELANSLARAVRPQEDRPYDPVAMEKPIKGILRSLWRLVVKPIADALENDLGISPHSRIWWCPTSVFSALPLHAAGHYTAKHPDQNITERFVSSYTPTVQALLRARRDRGVGKGEKMLIVAQPDTPGQSRLPNAQTEAELVKKLVESPKMEVTLFSGEEGTQAAVLGGMVDHSWLHLTCHGMQHPVNPLYSCFSLHDKPLTLQEIMQRGLPDATFAFLAACHTATGDRRLLDEGLHLAAGLQFAGFKSVVGTFWEVADNDAPLLAAAFYTALRASRSQAEEMDCSGAAYALSKAVKQLRDIGVPIHRWMRFLHIGI